MRKEYLLVIFVVLLVFPISLVCAQNLILDKSDYNTISKIQGTFYKFLDKNDSKNILITKNSMRALYSSNINGIMVVWPKSGYSYITDSLQLEINANEGSTCSYNLNGGNYNSMEIVNGTDYSHIIYNLADNMASDTPYIIDFKCTDNSGTESTAETYFWINLEDLNKYFIRSDIENWKYLESELWWKGNDDGLLETYDAYYSNNAGVHSLTEIVLFDSENSITKYINDVILNESIWNSNVHIINRQNLYFLQSDSLNAVAWKNGTYLLFIMPYPYKNSTPVDTQVPLSLTKTYLSKYPSDIKYGVCGDGKVDIFNLDGKKEDCDKNSETTSCGSNIGECKAGQKTRKCKSDCTWDNWGVCNATQPKTELCDGKDNNCDGKIDESFPLLNQTCYVGVGACRQGGRYICSSSGSNVTCSAVAKTPQKEKCNDGIDNDCDGLIDFNDTKDCTLLKINSPINGFYYSNKNILFDISSDYNPSNIFYTYFDNPGKEVTVKLCSKCNTYNKTKSFNDGFYNLTIAVSNKSQILSKKQLSFLVDSTSPKISETLPKKGFTNGNFSIEFKEDNPKILILNYDKQKKSLNISKECILEKGIRSCITNVNLSNLDGKEIEYYFNLTDINGKSVVSKPIKLAVDTTIPIINNPNSFWSKDVKNPKYINFNISITELNLDSVQYLDSFDGVRAKWNTFCSRLDKNNRCITKKSFKTGAHNLKIMVKDKARNSVQKDINFNIS